MSSVMNDRLPHHRITVEEYYRMAEEGRLKPDARYELIEGEIIEMPPMGSPHAGQSTKLMYLLMDGLRSVAQVRVQMPLHLDDCSEPEPDLALVFPRQDFYKGRHPTAADTILVVEVSQSSLADDTERKVPLYARHGVPEVWLVDLQRKQLRLHRSPQGGQYTSVSTTGSPGATELAALPGRTVNLAGLFA